MVKNLRHVGIVVTNEKVAIEFYNKLGFKFESSGYLSKFQTRIFLDTKTKNGLKWIKLAVDKNILELYIMDKDDISSSLYGELFHISLTTDNIEEDYKKFEYFAISDIQISDKHKLFFMRDPFGNLIEMVEPPKG